jgi:hypothetical protein
MTTRLKWCDGVVLIDDPPLYRIRNIQSGRSVVVDWRSQSFLAGLGHTDGPLPPSDWIDALIELGLFERAEPNPDSVLEKHVRQTDAWSIDSHPQLYEKRLGTYCTQKYVSMRRLGEKANPAVQTQRACQINDRLQNEASTVGLWDDVFEEALTFLGHRAFRLDTDKMAPPPTPLHALVIGRLDSLESVHGLLRYIERSLTPKTPVFMPLPPEYALVFLAWANPLGVDIIAWESHTFTYINPYTGRLEAAADQLIFRLTREPTREAKPRADISDPIKSFGKARGDKRYVGVFNDIPYPRYIQPMYLDMLLDQWGQNLPQPVQVQKHLAQQWTYIAWEHPHYSFRLHANRALGRIGIDLYPFHPPTELALRLLILAVFERAATEGHLYESSHSWLFEV